MYNRGPGLSASKNGELQRALSSASSETRASGFALEGISHPVTREVGFAIPPTAPDIGDANLVIVQDQHTGIIQFVFPVQSGQPLLQGPAGAPTHNFAFIRPLQLGASLTDAAKWIVKAALSIPATIATDTVWGAARAVEALNKIEGFIDIAHGYGQPATTDVLNQAQGKKVLLFVHGIFSSIQGAFDDLGDPASGTTMNKLVNAYDGHVFGYNHWTISKTPLQNALDLLDAIPDGASWDVDIVCHSRGGLVVRSMLSSIVGHADLNNADLNSVAQEREGKIRSVGNTFFVAAANQGSPLANPDEIRNFLNLAAFLASKSECFSLDLVIGLARVLVSAAFDLPSVQELATTSTLVSDLNTIGSLMSDDNTFGARADFDHTQSPLLESGVLLDKLLMPVDNDLVVPYAGVASPDPDIASDRMLPGFGTPDAKQGRVWHTEFFSQMEIHNFLGARLVPGWVPVPG